MNLVKYRDKICFRLKDQMDKLLIQPFRHLWYRSQGAKIVASTRIPPIMANWQHQIQVGENCSTINRVTRKPHKEFSNIFL